MRKYDKNFERLQRTCMKAFWYNDDRKNVCGIKIRELRKEKHISTKKLEIIFYVLSDYIFVQ